MTMTQFAMVEELAFLIKDNLYCKHLVLSTEDALINFLQNDSSAEGVLELQPVSPYERLLLHRLADIYGFAHESVGEGEERHLLLERCPETAIPPILVSDILCQYEDYQSPMPAHLILRRRETSETKVEKAVPSPIPLKEREAAYLAARERIFSLHEDDEREVVHPKSRRVPVVAQRMIAHALGQKVSSLHKCGNDKSEESSVSPPNYAKENNKDLQVQNPVPHSEDISKSLAKLGTHDERAVSPEMLEKERIGAAKRIFSLALGKASVNRKDSTVRTKEGRGATNQ